MKITCHRCRSERVIPEDKLVDLRCLSPGCIGNTVLFDRPVLRRFYLDETWEKVEQEEEVSAGVRTGTLTEFLWFVKPRPRLLHRSDRSEPVSVVEAKPTLAEPKTVKAGAVIPKRRGRPRK